MPQSRFNTWLVFRRVVDLILMCDFTSYCLFAIACAHQPVDESVYIASLRWTAGVCLVGFNLWVKLDAYRVVKDYAWCWGDFFYLIDQELTFDGVFEMAPHPMYSVGYAGYYGISLMAASYKVLIVSVVAHAAQFAFLLWVENPHIDKIYNTPPPRENTLIDTPSDSRQPRAGHVNGAVPLTSSCPPSPAHNMIGIHNIDFYRATDTSIILLQICLLLLTLSTPSTPFVQALFVAHAVIWRL